MRGVVRFTAGDTEYSLRFTTNRLCVLEEETGNSVMHYAALLGEPGATGLSDVRRLIRVGLDCSDLEAGDIIDQIGLQPAVQLIAKALAAAFNIPTDGKAGAGAGKPKAGAV